jgi:eukaryotic-like serine/threonine-protein kinase
MTQEEQLSRQVGIQSNSGGDININSPVTIAGRDVVHHHYPSSNPEQMRNRQTLLDRVHLIWIEGVLESSLAGATFIPLGLYERPDLIENPWISVVQEAKQAEHLVPSGTSITQVYDEAKSGLLLLGKPGSGKTTLLLQLARDLLDRADLDEIHPMPVVFNLSTWAEKRQSLSEWLIAELDTRYQIQRNVGKVWVDTGQVLPLLDGLDEVAEEYRATCIDAINAFRKKQGTVPVVIGSRLAEYTAQASKIVVRKAVIVQPLTLQQVHEYLEKAEGQFGDLQAMLDDDPEFQEFARNPLMLRIMKLAYEGKPVHLARNASPEEWRRQIFTDYVKRMFQRRRAETRYSAEQTKYWLIWLAKQMKQRDQTAFYLERLQLDWLANSRSCEIYTSLAFGLLSFPVAASTYGLEFGNFLNGACVGLLTAMIAFFFVWSIETDIRVGTLFPSKSRRNPITRARKSSRLATFLTSLLGERAGFAFLSGLLNALLIEFLLGPFYAPTDGLYLAAFLVMVGKFTKEIQPAERLVWSWKSVQDHAVSSLLLGLGIGLLVGFFDALPYFQQLSVFLTTLYFWLSFGCALGVIIMLMRGFTSSILDTKQVIKPNQGIRNSLSNSLRLGPPSGLLLGVVAFFFFSFVIHNVFRVGYLSQLPQNADIAFGADGAVAVSYLFWLINGGFACVQHLVLRVLLWRTGCTPWRYPRFLDYAHERTLLRKVGGGCVFIHELLLDYFANLGMEEDMSY